MAPSFRFDASKHRRDRRGRFARKNRPGLKTPDLRMMSSGDGQRIREWVAQAHERTAVEAIESPPGFVADCDAAPGALAFASTAEAAIEEMRSVLLGWASLRVERGHDLPHLRRDAATR